MKRPVKKNIDRRRSKKRMVSSINPKMLVKSAVKSTVKPYTPSQCYADMALRPEILKNLSAKGYTHPTEIQDKAIASLISGRNMVGIAATGTGKTGAFLIPIVEQMLCNKGKTALVVVPTRELAEQVLIEFKALSRGMGLSSACFIGGTNVGKDLGIARRKQDLIVGTPGRLLDLVNQGALRLKGTEILVLDEFDRMLDMGFLPDVKSIVSCMKSRMQTMLFSATLKSDQEKHIQQLLSDPIRIKVSSGTESSDNVEQNIIKVKPDENKFDLLKNLLLQPSFEKVILFAETKRSVDKIQVKLQKVGVMSDVIHGNKSQNYRSNAIRKFKSGKTRVLVATDVAARGIDVDGVTHVINYQLPLTMDSYIHRIGRTGRAGKTGMAYTFIN
ncbi:DEAD/DEAH box helicase [Luteibaculum oceani]|uniref:DEAD/DEAH box helicase n=1 Tax=Luteibaculum oceani TaxID=1294296 RepID=A0A5C6USL6_9FLAO|nr:DEAD/DEAH box helicase [Luteibaculum oceani]TXC75644.1 DEAD/DEAH box helicase [Luteibaculum oceani]